MQSMTPCRASISRAAAAKAAAGRIMLMANRRKRIQENDCDHVDVAIGMNTSIGIEAALVFASQFYSSIVWEEYVKT